jgi:hypothetical protein
MQQFLPLSEAEIQGLLHPAQDNLGYVLMWFQSLQLHSTQSESPLDLVPFISNFLCIQLWTEFFILHISTQINSDRESRYSDYLRAGRPRGRSSSPGRVKNFLFSRSASPVLRSTQPPVQWVPGTLSPGVKRPGREVDHSPPTSAEENVDLHIHSHTPPSWRSA